MRTKWQYRHHSCICYNVCSANGCKYNWCKTVTIITKIRTELLSCCEGKFRKYIYIHIYKNNPPLLFIIQWAVIKRYTSRDTGISSDTLHIGDMIISIVICVRYLQNNILRYPVVCAAVYITNKLYYIVWSSVLLCIYTCAGALHSYFYYYYYYYRRRRRPRTIVFTLGIYRAVRERERDRERIIHT